MYQINDKECNWNKKNIIRKEKKKTKRRKKIIH
jgi:hypothetical protein